MAYSQIMIMATFYADAADFNAIDGLENEMNRLGALAESTGKFALSVHHFDDQNELINTQAFNFDDVEAARNVNQFFAMTACSTSSSAVFTRFTVKAALKTAKCFRTLAMKSWVTTPPWERDQTSCTPSQSY